MTPWETLARAAAPDGKPIELRRRGGEFLIRADGSDLMSSEDDVSSTALAELGLACVPSATRVLVGGLGMGFTLRAALDRGRPDAIVEVAELIDAVVEWNRGVLGEIAGRPLDDARAQVYLGDVRDRIRTPPAPWHAILLDVDNGPDALAHTANEALYGEAGLADAFAALHPGGVLGVWSFSDDPRFTRRCRGAGFSVRVERVSGSRKGRGRHHFIWLARRPG